MTPSKKQVGEGEYRSSRPSEPVGREAQEEPGELGSLGKQRGNLSKERDGLQPADAHEPVTTEVDRSGTLEL